MPLTIDPHSSPSRGAPPAGAGWSRTETIVAAAIVVCACLTIAVAWALTSGGDPSPRVAAGASPSPSPRVSSSPSGADDRGPSETWRASRTDPVHVWIAGDSMGEQLAGALAPMLERGGAFTVSSETKTSTGLCRPDFYDWSQRVRMAVRTMDPDAVVVLIGGNDTQDVNDAGEWLAFGSAAWKRVYRERVADVMESMLAGGVRRIYWVGMPICAQSWRNDQLRVINGIYRSEARRHRGTRYIDAWELFSSNGVYTASGRLADGVHFTVSGEEKLARAVTAAMARDWR